MTVQNRVKRPQETSNGEERMMDAGGVLGRDPPNASILTVPFSINDPRMTSSTEGFDPYLIWLGIRHPERPPDHYRLLGVEPFESDLEVIAFAADRQMAHVRRFQNGERSQLSQDLLNELAAARVCLLRPELKAEYDAALRATAAVSSPRPDTSPGVRRAMPVPRRRSVGTPLLIVVTFGLLLASVLFFRRNLLPDSVSEAPGGNTIPEAVQSPPPPAPIPGEIVESADNDGPSEPPIDTPTEPSVEPLDANAPSSSVIPTPPVGRRKGRQKLDEAPATAPGTGGSARKVPETGGMAQGERTWMVAAEAERVEKSDREQTTYGRFRAAVESRNLTAAWREWERLASESRSYEQRDAVDRLRYLLFRLERFWEAAAGGFELLQPGMAIGVGNQRLTITEVQAELVRYEANGKSSQTSRKRTEADREFAALMASLYLGSQGGAPQPLVAEFLAVDGGGDPAASQVLRADTEQRGFVSP